MSISIQTNVDSLIAQQNLNVNSQFQSKTIQQLTSGYRINSAADDAAGLAVANGFRDSVAQLTQGVSNANDGVAQLQIVDGGLSNISQILDRMQTLATESASSTFTGDRNTLNNEYQSLIGEINRQAANIGLVQGGTNNNVLSVFIGGGGSVQANSEVSVDLSGTANQVDAAGLKLAATNVAAGGTTLSGNSIDLNNTANSFSVAQNFTFNIAGQTQPVTVSYDGSGGNAAGILTELNNQLSQYGITASTNSQGYLQFSGGVAFSVKAQTLGGSGATGIANDGSSADYNAGMYAYNAAAFAVPTATAENVTITNSTGSVNLAFTAGNSDTLGDAISYMNPILATIGLTAVKNTSGGLSIQGSSTFTINQTQATGNAGVLDAAAAGSLALATPASGPTTGATSAQAALTAVTNAISALGLVQGRVGAGENKLNYAINLAQSQITNFSSAESQIRDADVAAEAANLSKSQVLQQASIAAMAQANAEPQAVLALLKG
jgi:flagellin